MRQNSELLLNFLLNATWQILLISAVASLASWFFRDAPARYRHVVWTVALMLAFFIPAVSVTTDAILARSFFVNRPGTVLMTEVPIDSGLPASLTLPDDTLSTPLPQLNRWVVLVLITGYLSLLGFRIFRFLQGWRMALWLRRSACEIVDDERVRFVIRRCETALGPVKRDVKVLSSASLHVPVTVGVLRPVIILPQQLVLEQNIELLTSAIGHEYIHVARHDYVFNLINEFLYLPISFHPAAAFIRRCIRQTRELCCDELVAQRIIKPEAYARSLVKLAGSTPPLRRLSVSTTVGIADADILEARIMSLLKKPRIDTRWKRNVLVVASMLLVVPCVAAAAFAMHFEMQPTGEALVQEPVLQEKERRKENAEEKENIEREAKIKHEIQELRGRLELLAQEPVSQEKEKEKLMETAKIKENLRVLENRLAGGMEEQRAYAVILEGEARERHIAEEQKAIKAMQAALVRVARIQMDQAIQIATSLNPGKVLECTLNAERWEEPGKLAKDATVFYHVEVLSGEEPNQVITHVLVNAIDGTIIRAEKELPRKRLRIEQP